MNHFVPFLQYHPDVCRGSNCGVQFHRINEAYDVNHSSPPITPVLCDVMWVLFPQGAFCSCCLLVQMVMSQLRGESADQQQQAMNGYEEGGPDEEGFRGMNDPDWELWEEWMGWEGAGIRDYSSHINPYI